VDPIILRPEHGHAVPTSESRVIPKGFDVLNDYHPFDTLRIEPSPDILVPEALWDTRKAGVLNAVTTRHMQAHASPV
jgi:hypothetical protein